MSETKNKKTTTQSKNDFWTLGGSLSSKIKLTDQQLKAAKKKFEIPHPKTANPSFSTLQKKVIKFRNDRGWKKHHNPKNLALSILIEAAELAEHFQWENFAVAKKHRQDPAKKKEIAHELADVIIYCLSFADIMKINLPQAIINKLKISQKKFPLGKQWTIETVKKRRQEWKRKK